jgi:hypothetical protein
MRAVAARVPGLFCVVATLAGCELSQVTVATPESLVVAEIYLRWEGGTRSAQALLHQTRGESPVPLAGATIRIEGEGGGAWMQPAVLPACIEGPLPEEFEGACFRLTGSPAGFIRPGGRYTVEVNLDGGRRIHGSVTLPGDFRIETPRLSPFTGERCHLPPGAQLPLAWTASAGARAYVPEAEIFGLDGAFLPEGIEVPSDPVTLLGLSVSERDTTIVFPAEFGIFNRFSSDREILVALQRGLPAAAPVDGVMIISAQGRNSVNWNRGGNFNPSGQVRTPSLFGDGTGVVGGIVNRSFAFTTAEEPGIPPCLPEP